VKAPAYLGVDVGSVSTNLVVIDRDNTILQKEYLRTRGNPVNAIKTGLERLGHLLDKEVDVTGVGTTGSGRSLAGVILGADLVKNEITAHAAAASTAFPDARTILEIGGQDSKIIVLRHGTVTDFAMNTVCAAGTGSFLDQQATRLGIPIERFGELALKAEAPVRIAGRCTVFAESDMIHKQQLGHNISDIIAGLCRALVRNYLNNVGKGKDIQQQIVFQGGVAANAGIRAAFEAELGAPVLVPDNYDVMGAFGAALLVKEQVMDSGGRPKAFHYGGIVESEYSTSGFECHDCPNNCEIVIIKVNGRKVASWGSRCGKWDVDNLVSAHLFESPAAAH